MKILVCTQVMDMTHPILGFFHAWVVAFAQKFEEVHVICLQKGQCELPKNVFVYSLGKEDGVGKLTYIYRFYRYFFQIYRTKELTYVLYHMGAVYNILGAPFFLLRKRKHIRFLWWKTHGHINLMGRVALLFVDEVLSASADSFPVRTQKLRVTGHAIDTSLFTMRNEHASSKEVQLLFVGRIMRVKRVEDVLAVAVVLRNRNVSVRVRIVGVVADDGYQAELEHYCREYDLSSVVTFAGPRTHTELIAEYHNADILINPSDTDSIDKVVLEAMACGVLPLSSTRAFDALLSPHQLFMKKGDSVGYADSVERILQMPESERGLLAHALREVVVRDHALETLTKRIFNHD